MICFFLQEILKVALFCFAHQEFLKVVIKTFLFCSSRQSNLLSANKQAECATLLGPSVEDFTFYMSFIRYSAIGLPFCYHAVAFKFLFFVDGEPDLI